MSRSLQRPIRKTLRFTREEWSTVADLLKGRDFSSITRSALLGCALPEPRQTSQPVIMQCRMSEFEAKKIQQLSWIGNNLNQIARRSNSGGMALDILIALLALEREMRELIR
jgi:hypothetical protein